MAFAATTKKCTIANDSVTVSQLHACQRQCYSRLPARITCCKNRNIITFVIYVALGKRTETTAQCTTRTRLDCPCRNLFVVTSVQVMKVFFAMAHKLLHRHSGVVELFDSSDGVEQSKKYRYNGIKNEDRECQEQHQEKQTHESVSRSTHLTATLRSQDTHPLPI